MRNHSYENDFYLQEKETACRTHFHMKGFALSLGLKKRHERLGNGLFYMSLEIHPLQCDTDFTKNTSFCRLNIRYCISVSELSKYVFLDLRF